MNTAEAKDKVESDADFVNIKRFDYSLAKLIERYPDGCPDHIIAQALLVSEDDVGRLYADVVGKMRGLMGVRD